jgi:hypothetical protein
LPGSGLRIERQPVQQIDRQQAELLDQR